MIAPFRKNHIEVDKGGKYFCGLGSSLNALMQPCGRNDNREHDEVDEHAFPATKLSSRNSMQQPDAIDGEFLCIGILKICISILSSGIPSVLS